MVIKCETCAFSGYKIYPAHGKKFIRRDGQPFIFINAKSCAYFRQGMKSSNLTWTISWRKKHKKTAALTRTRRRTRRTAKAGRTIGTVTRAEIERRSNKSDAQRTAERDALKRQLKEARKAAKAAAKGKRSSGGKAARGAPTRNSSRGGVRRF
jgi:large subunit ribosomal protein L24e